MTVRPWEDIGHEVVHQTRVFSLRKDRARQTEGGPEREYHVLEAPDWVNVIALTDESRVLLIRQYRQGTKQITVEIPGGMVDPGETPLQAARRELLEETGYEAVTWEQIGVVAPNPALQNNHAHTFLARGARCTGVQDPDEDEEIDVEEIPLNRIPKLLADGTIEHSLVVAAFAFLSMKGLLGLDVELTAGTV